MFLILTMSFVSADLTDGLLGYWKLDETSGTILSDSISSNHLTAGNTAIVNKTGIINKAIGLTTTNDNYWAQKTNVSGLDIAGDISISFWIKLNQTIANQPVNYPGILEKGSTGQVSMRNFASYFAKSANTFTIGGFSSESANTSFEVVLSNASNYFDTTNWKLITITRKKSANNSDVKLYINGTVITSGITYANRNENTLTTYKDLSFLSLNNTAYYSLINLDEIGIWNRELSQSEVTKLYNSGVGDSYPFITLTPPTASVGTGTYNNNFSVTLDNDSVADIYYTTDGSDPDDTDTLYSGAISITGTTTLKAISWVSDENKSEISSYIYTMVIAGTPTADKDSGLYYDPFNVTLTKTGTTTDTTLTYTLTGADPTIASTEYTTPIEISADTTLKFAEFKTGYTATSIVTKTYEVREPITNFYFYDENTLGAIATVTITDSNGSIYTSDGDGLWTTSLSNVAKSFTISKTGYDTRDLEFYFKRQDANFNFMLSQDDNSSSINFLVKDSNDNLWSNKYLMFVNDTNIITSVLTSATGYATANILPAGDYNALLYNATGDLNYTYAKTTVTVNKPKNEITLGAISPYDITVGGLLGYSLTNQSAASVAFNVFAGTTDFYHFSVVDYNAVAADRKYIPRQYFTQVPMGTEYSSTLLYQPYLLLETDAVVPKITVIDELNKPIGDVDIFISRYISNVLTIVESGKTTAVGTLSFSAYPLEYYYVSVIYNGVDKGTYRVQPRESTDNFIIVIDTTTTTTPSTYIITADFSDTNKVVNIDDSNISVDVTVKQSQNLATTYNLYLMQNNVVKASTSGAIASRTKNITYTFDSSVVDTTNNNLVIRLVVNYPDGNQTFYYTITTVENEKGLMYYAPKMVGDIGQPLAIILAILITGIILAVITLSGLNIGTTAIAILGILILGVFMFLGWLDIGVTVAGFDIARFFYILMSIAMIYMLMRGEQYA